MSKSWLIALTLLVVPSVSACAQEKADGSTAADPIAPLGRFVGGEWKVEGKWSNGQELRARSVYVWGVNKKVIMAKTFVQDGKGGEYQRYEDVMFWHPQQKRLMLHTYAFNGAFGETVTECPEANKLRFGFTPVTADKPSKVRQTIVFTDDDTFTWKVEMQNKDKWEQLIEATWKRQTVK
jgi:hypothetical protein